MHALIIGYRERQGFGVATVGKQAKLIAQPGNRAAGR